MKSLLKWFATASLLAAMAPVAGLAQGINKREHNQQQRIRQGIGSGELTRREVLRLEKEQARIRFAEARARNSGGVFTLRERARIQRELNQSSRHIRRQKHDRQDR